MCDKERRKWQGKRGALLRAAAAYWIPIENLRRLLNSLRGPKLTVTDIAQRLERSTCSPMAVVRASGYGWAALSFTSAKSPEGTEVPAVIGALQVFVE